MTPDSLKRLVRRAFAQHPHIELTPQLLEVCHEQFGALPYEPVSKALNRVLATTPHPPKVSDLHAVLRAEQQQNRFRHREAQR